MAQLTENQQERLNNLQYVSGGVALVGSIVGVIYSSRTGGGFWRGVGYWVLGGLVFGIPAALVTMPFKSKILKEGDGNAKDTKGNSTTLTQGEADAIAQKMAGLAMSSMGIVGLTAAQQLELKSISERLSLGGYKIDPTSKKAVKK